ncbi:hypothetical protein [Dactylosporangium darangshiense]
MGGERQPGRRKFGGLAIYLFVVALAVAGYATYAWAAGGDAGRPMGIALLLFGGLVLVLAAFLWTLRDPTGR